MILNLLSFAEILINDRIISALFDTLSLVFKGQKCVTVMILSFRTDMSGQTVADPDQTAPDQGLHCLPFRLHRLDSLLYGRAT